MPFPFFQIDSFASEAFRGNPAAVVLLDQQQPDSWLQSVAMENNLSETAFVLQLVDGSFRLRWFTPTTEVNLCGHATLAAAHALWESERVAQDQTISFDTRSGVLSVSIEGGDLQMNFPVTPVQAVDAPPDLLSCFHHNDQPVEAVDVLKSTFDYVIVVKDESTVRGLSVDFRRLAKFDVRGVIVTAVADVESEHDIVSRFFAPAAGVDEDPVTGSAHCALIDYWGRVLNRTKLNAFQASARGGRILLEKHDDRVLLTGSAITVIRGELLPS